MSSMPEAPNQGAFDISLAFVAGERVWHDGPIQPGPREQIAAGFALFGAVCTIGLIWVAVAVRFDLWDDDGVTERRVALLVVSVAATLAAVALVVRYQRTLRGHEAAGRPFWFEVAWRAGALLIICSAFAGALPRAHAFGVIPLGILAGADASLTLWTLGATPPTRIWMWRFLISPAHFGAVGAVLAVGMVGNSLPALRMMLSLYLAMWVGMMVAAFTVVVVNKIAAAVDERVAEESHEVLVSERARRAHWLHDDVLSEVHLASLRISSGSVTPEQINAELLDLDHRLRLRQLDDMMSAGAPRVYEILQPHLRRVQNLGVVLERVPSHEVTRLDVDERCGPLLSRAVSRLTSNAVNAGTTRLAIDLQAIDGGTRLLLSVTDDAGGFDLAAVPAGRGLSTLMDQLGAAAVQRYDAPGGSMMVVTLPRTCDSTTRQPVDHRHQHTIATADRERHRHEHHDEPDQRHTREITT